MLMHVTKNTSKKIAQRLVHNLILTISLRMAKSLQQFFPKMGCEFEFNLFYLKPEIFEHHATLQFP